MWFCDMSFWMKGLPEEPRAELKDQFSRRLDFQHQVEARASFNTQDFPVAQICSYVGNILYKYKANCRTCSEAFLILLPQLCEGIKTTAGYICADCSKCWDMLAVSFRLVCVCFLFIQNVCLPLKDPIALGLQNYPKIQQILSSQPSQGYCCCSASPMDALWMLSKLRIQVLRSPQQCYGRYSVTPSGVLRQETNSRKRTLLADWNFPLVLLCALQNLSKITRRFPWLVFGRSGDTGMLTQIMNARYKKIWPDASEKGKFEVSILFIGAFLDYLVILTFMKKPSCRCDFFHYDESTSEFGTCRLWLLSKHTAELFLTNLSILLPDYKHCCQACHLLLKITKITSMKVRFNPLFQIKFDFNSNSWIIFSSNFVTGVPVKN